MSPTVATNIESLNETLSRQSTEEVLSWAWDQFGTRAAIGTSFQGSGLVLIHICRQRGLDFPVFTLDTGLLFPETNSLKDRLEKYFGIKIENLAPDLSVQEQANIFGPELWHRNPDQCCSIRKVVPLRSRLQDLDCWITGVRRHQSDSRSRTELVELYSLDDGSDRELVKLNPVAGWTHRAIWDYIRQHQIPYNPLHDQGYRSIGCMPCTRPTREGDSERAGRWTGFQKTECGIHTFLSKKT